MLDFSKLKDTLKGLVRSITLGILGCSLSCGIGGYLFWLGQRLLAEGQTLGIECFLFGLVFVGAGIFILLAATIEPACDSIKRCIIKSPDQNPGSNSYTEV
jgi:hypothetical protein